MRSVSVYSYINHRIMVQWKLDMASGMFKHDTEPAFLVPCFCRIQLEKHGGLQTANPQACFTKRREGNPKTHTHAFALPLRGLYGVKHTF